MVQMNTLLSPPASTMAQLKQEASKAASQAHRENQGSINIVPVKTRLKVMTETEEKLKEKEQLGRLLQSKHSQTGDFHLFPIHATQL